jgi:hypothetical protein
LVDLLWQYLAEIFDHWLFSWGAIVLMVIAMIEKLRDKTVSKRIFMWLAAACFVIAMFQAWKDQYEARGVAETAQHQAEQKLEMQQPKLEGVIEQTIYEDAR